MQCQGLLLVSHSVMSDSLPSHGLQHARLSCPSLSPGVCLNSCPLSRWCHLTIPSSCHPLLLLPSIFPSMRVFPNESGLHIRWPEYWSFSISERIPKGKKSTAIGQVLVTLHNNLIEISELFCRSWGPHQRADD